EVGLRPAGSGHREDLTYRSDEWRESRGVPLGPSVARFCVPTAASSVALPNDRRTRSKYSSAGLRRTGRPASYRLTDPLPLLACPDAAVRAGGTQFPRCE